MIIKWEMNTYSLPPPVADAAPPRRQGRRRKFRHDLPTLPPEEVRGALQRMIASPDFPASGRNRRFLAHVVEKALEGRGEAVSGYEVATEVFGRDKDFNATTDPIVRIEAGKLRRDLETYYLKAGRAESVLISLPRGAYWPVFQRKETSGLAAEALALDPAGLTVHALHAAQDRLGVEGADFRAQVVDALTRHPDLAVFTSQAAGPADDLLDSDTARELARRNGTRFVLSGQARESGDGALFTARLHDGATGRQVWAEDIGGNGCSLLENLVSRVMEVRRSLIPNGGAGEVA